MVKCLDSVKFESISYFIKYWIILANTFRMQTRYTLPPPPNV